MSKLFTPVDTSYLVKDLSKGTLMKYIYSILLLTNPIDFCRDAS